MRAPTTPAFEVALRLAQALDRAAIPYAIGGAIAWGVWADPRGTYDVDLNLFVRPDELPTALGVLIEAGLEIDPEAACRADAAGRELVGQCGGLRVDLFTPSIPFAWEAAKTRRRLRASVGEADFLSPESIAVFKLLFFRPKDRVDLEKLLAVQGGRLDAPYVRRWMVEMMGEGDERVTEWDQLMSRYWK